MNLLVVKNVPFLCEEKLIPNSFVKEKDTANKTFILFSLMVYAQFFAPLPLPPGPCSHKNAQQKRQIAGDTVFT